MGCFILIPLSGPLISFTGGAYKSGGQCCFRHPLSSSPSGSFMELGPAGQFKIIFEKAGSAVAILKAINRDNCRLRPQIEKRFPGVTSHNQRSEELPRTLLVKYKYHTVNKLWPKFRKRYAIREAVPRKKLFFMK